MFYTKYNLPPFRAEVCDGPDIVEKTHLSPKQQIESMIYAGKRLNQARAEQFDFPSGEEDELFSDPTRTPGFDLADAAQIANRTKQGLRETTKAIKRKQTAKVSKDPQIGLDPSSKPSIDAPNGD